MVTQVLLLLSAAMFATLVDGAPVDGRNLIDVEAMLSDEPTIAVDRRHSFERHFACRHRSRKQLHGILATHTAETHVGKDSNDHYQVQPGGHESHFLLPEFKKRVKIHDVNNNKSKAVSDTSDRPHCSETTNSDLDASVRVRSTCPWHYAQNHDSDRYPSTLVEARCICDHCIGGGKLTRCEPIFYSVQVLRRSEMNCDEDGFYKYVPEWNQISIGCTCARNPKQ